MVANKDMIFSRVGDVQWNAIALTAATGSDPYGGTGSNVLVAFTADAENGGWLDTIRLKSLGTNVGTVARIFINNGQDPTLAVNNVLYDEVTLASTTATATGGNMAYEVPLAFALPPAFRILISLGTTVAAGWKATVIGGKF